MFFFLLHFIKGNGNFFYFTPQLALIEHQILPLLQIHFEDCRGLSSYTRASRRDKSKDTSCSAHIIGPSWKVYRGMVCHLVPKLIRSTSMQAGLQIFQSFSNKDLTEHCEGFSMTHWTIKAVTHQANIKELAVMKADRIAAWCHLCLGQRNTLEHTAKTTANGQRAHTMYSCMRGNNGPYQQVVVVWIHHSERDI